jgi:spore maturation protein CgeB
LTNSQRSHEYFRHRIALNMHLSERRETGNLRMYEAPFHGLMLLCDRGADDLHETIFEKDREAVFYDDVEDGIEKAQYYLKNDSAREKIARAGYERVVRDYTSDKCMLRFLEWAIQVRKRPIGAPRVKSKGAVG